MLATLVAEPFSREGWIFEPKLDGIRCLIHRRDGKVELVSRNGNVLNPSFPELVDPTLALKPKHFTLDGEIVAFQGAVTSFMQLQRRMQVREPSEALRRQVAVFFYAFDLIHLEGQDLRRLPLLERKQLLRDHFRFHDPIRFSEHRESDGEAYYREACKKHWEGLIAKRADSPYVSGRSRDWLKFKCSAEQEFVIIGYTNPKGTREGFGALLLGYYEGSQLLFAGKVGTGFDRQLLNDLRGKMESLPAAEAPPGVTTSRDTHWVKPRYVAQVGFTEWTRDGRLRHPRFLGLRYDKPVKSVSREKPR
jgi:bifunctional non-homologous end joining protein LigD